MDTNCLTVFVLYKESRLSHSPQNQGKNNEGSFLDNIHSLFLPISLNKKKTKKNAYTALKFCK